MLTVGHPNYHMSTSSRKITEQEQGYQRQAEILRNKLYQWDQVLSTTGEEWPEQMGRFNAALVRIFFFLQHYISMTALI